MVIFPVCEHAIKLPEGNGDSVQVSSDYIVGMEIQEAEHFGYPIYSICIHMNIYIYICILFLLKGCLDNIIKSTHQSSVFFLWGDARFVSL